ARTAGRCLGLQSLAWDSPPLGRLAVYRRHAALFRKLISPRPHRRPLVGRHHSARRPVVSGRLGGLGDRCRKGWPHMIDVETPALLLYRDVMERNLNNMAGRAKKLDVSLRPHIKTPKWLELGRRQLALGAQGITVSTLFEAQAFARGGFTDLTWAFPLDPSHVPHVQRIARNGVTLRVILDDLDTAKALAGSGLHVWLKVDCGYHRAGVERSSRYAPAVARALG